MCGIAGFVDTSPRPGCFNPLPGMVNAITHRGPDESGMWHDEASGVALGHRRLSILELSAAGSQPMHSADKRHVLVFNGEIYNHLDLREQLREHGKAPIWNGHSDTETLLACISAWGLERTLKAAVGMFAIALWDRHRQTLSLARDRMGEKPLYWGWQGATLLFGSELKSLKAHPACTARVDRNALALYLRHGYIVAPHSIYEGIGKLPPGHYIDIPFRDQSSARAARSQPYWRMNHAVQAGLADPLACGDEEAADALEQQLMLGVRGQMLADVPLGAFLSGGVDSSLIVALMQAQSGKPVRTFTMGFNDERYDEAPYARAVAQHLGTQHSDMVVTPEEALAVIPDLPNIYDEPFADSSQIPTYMVSRLAKQHVTVALSGDAGDELFGGYNTYRLAPQTWHRIQQLPPTLRHAAAALLGGCASSSAIEGLLAGLRPLMPARLRRSANTGKMDKFADLLRANGQEDFYRRMISHWRSPETVVIGATEPSTPLNDAKAWPGQGLPFEQWLMAMDAQTYLPADILVKVDRAAMANSLETRVPLLDHRVIELAWRLPLDMKIRHGKGKWLLRQVLFRHVPAELIERPKKGFSIPLATWLRGPLRQWAENLLDETRLRREGYFDPMPIRQAWKQHLGGRRDCSTRLWCILMFQAWLETQ
ncbi:MAG TPA: asparagine synthase (glutamine-hydrolyzing) [Eoetvoesiella sp.]|uniref:asparagine synthase (glutamine-hydrolyzing) n=1 Tax=Eoetvoesiella sp. TaxID=1966355 RepID=UPI002BEE4C1C|nr:asparagine synthase (glutamine-hydrolyzing) [Eoetvoesiella sp.]HWK61996.1 asparagine synthase (glutamine-hydrolyzing) [Eoetvoesiella sp.]